MPHDKFIAYRDCETYFVFTTDEQDFYTQQGRICEPMHFYACRQQRKARDGRGHPRPRERSSNYTIDR